MVFLLLLFPESPGLFSLAATLGGAIALVDTYFLVTRPRTLKFFAVSAISILLGYAVGSIVFLIGIFGIDPTESQYWALRGLYYGQAEISIGLAICLVASMILYAGSLFEQPVLARWVPQAHSFAGAPYVVWLSGAIILVAYLMGDFGYMGIQVMEDSRISPVAALAELAAPAITALLVMMLVRESARQRRLLLSGLLIGCSVTLTLMGRRYLLYSLIVSALALFLSGYRVKRANLLGFLFVGILASLTLYFGFQAFYAVRMASRVLGAEGDLVEILQYAPTFLWGTDAELLKAELGENVASRPFILGYFAILLGVESNQVPLWGEEFWLSLRTAIPSVLMPTKLDSLASSPEELTHPRYGFAEFDGPNSVLVAGFNDFGILGALIYPLAVVYLYRGFYLACRSLVAHEATRLFVIFALVFQLFSVEQALSAVIVTMRNLVVFIFGVWVLREFTALIRHRLKIRRPINIATQQEPSQQIVQSSRLGRP
jgi:hypothetical protein